MRKIPLLVLLFLSGKYETSLNKGKNSKCNFNLTDMFRSIEEGQPHRSVLRLFGKEDLRYPGYVEFDQFNDKALTLDSSRK